MIKQLHRARSLITDALDSARLVTEQAIETGAESDLLDVVRLRVMAREILITLEQAEQAVLTHAREEASLCALDDYTRPLGVALVRGGLTA